MQRCRGRARHWQKITCAQDQNHSTKRQQLGNNTANDHQALEACSKAPAYILDYGPSSADIRPLIQGHTVSSTGAACCAKHAPCTPRWVSDHQQGASNTYNSTAPLNGSRAQWELYSRGESMPRGSQEVLHMSSVHPTSLSMLASVSRYSACGGRGRVVTGVRGSERHRL